MISEIFKTNYITQESWTGILITTVGMLFFVILVYFAPEITKWINMGLFGKETYINKSRAEFMFWIASGFLCIILFVNISLGIRLIRRSRQAKKQADEMLAERGVKR